MPVLPISENDDSDNVQLIVAGFLQFPDDYDSAFEYYVKSYLRKCRSLLDAENQDPITIPASWVKALVVGRSLAELEKGAEIRSRNGMTAGCIVIAAFMCASLGRPVTLNGAMEVLERGSEKQAIKNGLKIKIYPNRGEIHKAWKAMRNVAHLYAASWLIADAIASDVNIPADVIVATLSVAAWLLDWANEQLITENGKKVPLIDRSLAWSIPARFPPAALPFFVKERTPDWLVEAVTSKRGSR